MVGVLGGQAGLREQPQAVFRGKFVLVAIVGDFDAAHQFHDKIGPALRSGARVQNFGDVGMVHHGQGLALGFEPGDDALGVHAQLDDLERHAPPHRLLLFGHIDHAAAASMTLLCY